MSLKALYENVPSEALHYFDHQPFSRHLRCCTTHYDPIFTPLFVSLGFTGSITIGSATIATASIASAIATTALSIGVSMLLSPKPPKPEDGKAPLTQAVPYRSWVVGRRRVSGAYMLWEALGNSLYAVQAIAGHPIHAVNRYWLHDDEVTLTGTAVDDLDGRYGGHVFIEYRVGLTPETPYTAAVDAFSSSGLWTNDHRGDGQASVGMVCNSPAAKNFSKKFPYGVPRLSVEVDGAMVWDYRIDDDPANPAAWVFSRNAALIMCWHQCFNEFGHLRNYETAILPVLDMWIEEANVCDEDIPRASGGTEKRYLVDGFDSSQNDPKVGTNAILSACDGWICERGDGALLFTVGKFRESRVATLTDADITGYQKQNDVLFRDECNRLVPKFTYPETDYTTADTDFFEDTGRQLTAGRVLAQEADYGWCTQWRQARRLGKRDWLRIQEKKRGSLDVRLSGINAIYSRWVRLSTPLGLPGLHDAVIENRRSVLALTKGGFTMDFVKSPESIDDWTPSTDEGQAPPIPEDPDAVAIPVPVIDSVSPVPSNGSVYLRITVAAPDDAGLTLSVRYRVADAGGGSPGQWVEAVVATPTVSGGFWSTSTNAVPADQMLDIQAAFVTSRGVYGDYSASTQVVAVVDPVAPDPVTDVSVTSGTGEAFFFWTSPNSANFAAAKIYWSDTDDFDTATYAGPAVYGAAGATVTVSRTISAGVRYGWITAVNRSDVASDPVATGVFGVS